MKKSEIFSVMDLVFRLKRVPRTGWNKRFPKGSKYKNRKVKDPESVADHSYGAALLALLVSEYEKFNKLKVLELVLVHDLMESITGDLVTTTLPEAEKKMASFAKKRLEQDAARKIAKLGGYGKRICELWQEYESGKTKEAKLANQLDKLEMDMQAQFYAKHGQVVDPVEFMDSNREMMKNPTLVLLFEELYRTTKASRLKARP